VTTDLNVHGCWLECFIVVVVELWLVAFRGRAGRCSPLGRDCSLGLCLGGLGRRWCIRVVVHLVVFTVLTVLCLAFVLTKVLGSFGITVPVELTEHVSAL